MSAILEAAAPVAFKAVGHHVVIYFNETRLIEPDELSAIEREIADHVAKLPLRASVVLNFDGVEHTSSQLVGVMLALKRQLARRGGTLTVCRIGSQLMDVLRLTHLEGQFHIVERMRDAVGSAKARTAPHGPTVPGRSNEPQWID